MNAFHDLERRGFTLVELLVSVLVFTIGLLALTGATAVIARQVNGGAQMALAASLAASRFEQMRAERCSSLTSGTSEARGIVERWTVTHSPGAVTVYDTVTFDSGRSRRVHAFVTAIACSRDAG